MAKSLARRDPSLTLLDTTALFLSCAVPTLFRGNCVTAQPVPVAANTNAMIEITSAGDGRFMRDF